MYCEVELRVIPFKEGEVFVDAYFCIMLLPNIADSGLHRRFANFNLILRVFPIVLPVIMPPVGGKYLVPFADDGG